MRGSCYGRVAGRHAVVYWSNTAKRISDIFQPSRNPIILVSSDPYTDSEIEGNSFIGAVKYTGVEQIGSFRRKSPFILDRLRDRTMTTMER